MGRNKSLEAVVIENFLAANNGNPCRYSSFLSSIEYQNHIAAVGKVVGQAFYNAVKSRYNRNNAVAASANASTTSSSQGGVSVPSTGGFSQPTATNSNVS